MKFSILAFVLVFNSSLGFAAIPNAFDDLSVRFDRLKQSPASANDFEIYGEPGELKCVYVRPETPNIFGELIIVRIKAVIAREGGGPLFPPIPVEKLVYADKKNVDILSGITPDNEHIIDTQTSSDLRIYNAYATPTQVSENLYIRKDPEDLSKIYFKAEYAAIAGVGYYGYCYR